MTTTTTPTGQPPKTPKTENSLFFNVFFVIRLMVASFPYTRPAGRPVAVPSPSMMMTTTTMSPMRIYGMCRKKNAKMRRTGQARSRVNHPIYAGLDKKKLSYYNSTNFHRILKKI